MRYLFSFFFFLTVLFAAHAEDILITRSGAEYRGKLELLSDKEVTFKVKGGGFRGGRPSQKIFPAEEVYMIKSDKRGYTFFNRKRERLMFPLQNIGKNADLIYLADGGEIPAWNISLKDGVIKYQRSAKPQQALSSIDYIPVKDIFMIKYHDGSKDVFTDITVGEEPVAKAPSAKETKIKVIFYTVLNGETIESIARKYDVTPDDLREWNDFSPSTKNTTKLTPGQQLMIQVETDS